MSGAARIRVGDPPHGAPTVAPTPPEVVVQRPERNPAFRGWCYWCGTPIFPSPHNFYCRTCAALMAKGMH